MLEFIQVRFPVDQRLPVVPVSAAKYFSPLIRDCGMNRQTGIGEPVPLEAKCLPASLSTGERLFEVPQAF